MLIVMSSQATAEQVEHVSTVIREMGLTPHSLPGATRTAIGVTGNLSAIDPEGLACLPGVKELLRVTKPYKLASREMHLDDSIVTLPMAKIGGKEFAMIAGPCSVESEDLVLKTAEYLMSRGIKMLRAGAFKPRTSPYAFQGMEHEGLRLSLIHI